MECHFVARIAMDGAGMDSGGSGVRRRWWPRRRPFWVPPEDTDDSNRRPAGPFCRIDDFVFFSEFHNI